MTKTKEIKQERNLWMKSVVEVLKGGALAIAVSVAMLVAAAALMMVGVLPREVDTGCAVMAGALGAIVAGLYAIGRCNGAALFIGIGTGLVEFAMLLGVGTVAFAGVSGGGEMRAVCMGCVCGGVVSGVLSAVLGRKRKRNG